MCTRIKSSVFIYSVSFQFNWVFVVLYAYDVTAFGRRATAVSVLLRLTLSPSFPCHDYYDFFERVNDTLCTVQTHSLHTFYSEVVDSFVALSLENSSFVSFVQTAKLLYVIPVAVFFLVN